MAAAALRMCWRQLWILSIVKRLDAPPQVAILQIDQPKYDAAQHYVSHA